ncbi:Sirohydrochlorin ferrochelatase [Cohaesibacter sp. ES.047]|uniref:CbiX/SirB N-terminal domain-containing protein n=1 Tax=Cohaesibacter sp. ES.047 TaxID=1798205 RepID=UPI000BB9A774|nr:CbiX/SirB N-terminal domain-containing protein [Cohaesibacter sp. ES.047]SNY92849.1 Sirohydrochlorin ferrochelatase [Cohaesibacter sp. ES.047]
MSTSRPINAVLIVAHGERGGRLNNARLLELADEVRSKLGDVEVSAGVLRGSPSIADAWSSLEAPNRFIYPFFMSDGYFCNRILPKKVREAIGEDDVPFTMLPPFGVSDDLAAGIAKALSNEIEKLDRPRDKPPILIAAHGASIDKQSSTRARELAHQLDKTGLFGPISCAFLDEAPHLEDVMETVDPRTLVLPHFNGLGSHSVDDMAKLSRRAPEGCHFVMPVGGQDWVGEVMTADIARALDWAKLAEAAE